MVLLCLTQLPSPAAAQATLTPTELKWLTYIQEEERMARDLYLDMYSAWTLSIFLSTSGEEQEHMAAVAELLKANSVPATQTGEVRGNYSHQRVQYLFDSLLSQGTRSKKDGLKACALQEEISIRDLGLAIQSTDQLPIQKVFGELQRDSFNHLRSFAHSLEALGERYKAVKLPQQTVDAIIIDKMDRGFLLR